MIKLGAYIIFFALVFLNSCSDCDDREDPIPYIPFIIVDENGNSLLEERVFKSSFEIIAINGDKQIKSNYRYYRFGKFYAFDVTLIDSDAFVFLYGNHDNDTIIIERMEILSDCEKRIQIQELSTNQRDTVRNYYDWFVLQDTAVVFVK